MSLVVLSGAARSGKSAAAERLALSRGAGVVTAVAGWDGDEEMARRIEAHQGTRPEGWETRLVTSGPGWIAEVGDDSVLLLDCLATLIGAIAYEEVGEAEVASRSEEAAAQSHADALVEALLERAGDTIVVSNEAGWGVVPSSAAGRLFRDLLGRANRALIARADAAYLVVDGRFLDLKALPSEPVWPDQP